MVNNTGCFRLAARLGGYDGTVGFSVFRKVFEFASAPTSFLICLVIGSGLKLSFKGLRLEVITAVLKVALALVFAFILSNLVLVP